MPAFLPLGSAVVNEPSRRGERRGWQVHQHHQRHAEQLRKHWKTDKGFWLRLNPPSQSPYTGSPERRDSLSLKLSLALLPFNPPSHYIPCIYSTGVTAIQIVMSLHLLQSHFLSLSVIFSGCLSSISFLKLWHPGDKERPWSYQALMKCFLSYASL